MNESNPSEYQMLTTLIGNLKTDLNDRMDRFEKNVNDRLDKFETRMDLYVQKAIFDSEIKHIRDELEASRIESVRAREAAKREAAQKVTWWIMIGGLAITALNIGLGLLFR